MIRRALLTIGILTLAGCVTTNMEEQFALVDGSIEDRTGYDLEWIAVTEEDDVVAQHVAELLEDELTADEAVQVALLNNRQLQATYAEMGVEVGEYIQAGLLPNPVVDVEARFRNSDEVIEGTVIEDFLEIFLIPLRRELQGAQLRAAQYRVTAEVIDLAAETRIGYWDFVAARQHYELAQDVLETTSAALDMAWQLRFAGNVPLLFYQQERARFEQAKLDVAEAEMELLDARESLNALMGLWGNGTRWQTPDRLPPVPEEEIEVADIEQRAIEASLDLPIAFYNIEVVARELGIRRVTAVIPEFKAGGAFEREPETEYKLKERKFGNEKEYELKKEDAGDIWWSGGVISIEVPIFDQKQGARAAARMEIRRRWELFTDLGIDIRAAARMAAYRLEYARTRAQFQEQVIVPVRHDITLQTHLQYNAMFLGIFELLRQKEDELFAARDYVETLRRYWRARTQVEQLLMGRLYDTNQPRMGNAQRDGMSLGIRGGQGLGGGQGGGH